MTNKRSRILLFDIETAPNVSYTWGKYEQNVIEFQKEWYMLSFAYKWLGDKRVKAYSLPDFKRYNKDKTDDTDLLKKLWELLNEAEIVIGHNSNTFDIKKSNSRFIERGMKCPSPYLTIDTLKEARKYFYFNSNKLNDLCRHLSIGGKIETGGFDLWLKCMEGDMKSWNKMVKYNKNDVDLLEKLYLKLRPWMSNHPNRSLLSEKERVCPVCTSNKVVKQGFKYTRVGKYQKWQCTDCGAWSQSRKIEKEFIRPDLK